MKIDDKLQRKKEVNKNYRRTKKGVVATIYSHQRQSSRKRNHELPSYTLDELREWAFNQPIFHELYEAWVQSGFSTRLTPSFDRTDDYQGYCLSRLKIMTWKENDKKGHDGSVNRVNKKSFVSVIQMTLKGEFIKKHDSATQAQRETNISNSNITHCCLKNRKSAGGFKWKYA